MKITILGAGAMGCMVARSVSSNNNEINLIDPYDDHMKEISKNGIRIIDNDKKETVVNVDYAGISSDKLEKQDLIVILVKGYDTEKILTENLNLIGTDTIVMTLQNGIGNVDIIKKYVREENIAQGIMYISASLNSPGVISTNFDKNKVNIIFGPSNKVSDMNKYEDIKKEFNNNDIKTEINMDVDRVMWRKLYVNAIYNLPCAVMHLSTRFTKKDSDSVIILKKISDEFIEVTNKLGYDFDGEKLFRKYVTDSVDEYDDIMPSAAQDTKKQRPTEAEFLNGAVVRKAKELGIETPFNEAIYRLAMVEMNNYKNRF